MLTAFLLASAGRWRAAVARAVASTRISFRLQFLVQRIADGKRLFCAFDYLPIMIGWQASDDIRLPTKERRHCTIDLNDGHLQFSSPAAIAVNGAACRQKRLRLNDCISFGNYRLYLRSCRVAKTRSLRPPQPVFLWQAPLLALLLLLTIQSGKLLRHEQGMHITTLELPAIPSPSAEQVVPAPIEQEQSKPPQPQEFVRPESSKNEHSPAQVEAQSESEARTAAVELVRLDLVQLELIKPQAVKLQLVPVAPEPAAPEPAAPEKPRPQPVERPIMVGPGELPDFFKADVVFIHAHPDDETLDFGVLMAKAAQYGKKTVTILFTDGEAGLDRYPKRPVGQKYPDYTLAGAELAAVRVNEARQALAILGAQMYIRLGMKNHPYNTIHDVKPPAKVLQAWGGETKLVERCVSLLEGFRPEVVVSPDSKSKAREHFEHETVGYIVKQALKALEKRGHRFIKGHLVSVDPFQTQKYSHLVTIDGIAKTKEGSTYRAVQAQALSQHLSQRDASVIGLKKLPTVKDETYYKVFWHLPQPGVEDYFTQ